MAETKQPTSPRPGEAGSIILQNIYFNGFNLGLSNADANALLLLDGQPVGRLSMSFTTAKTLVTLLGELVDNLEKATNHKIMTTEEVASGLQKFFPEEKK